MCKILFLKKKLIMTKNVGYIMLLALVLIVNACATLKTQINDALNTSFPNKDIVHSFYLIGDAGNSQIGSSSEGLKAFKEELKNVIIEVMLPESEEYRNELTLEIENKTENKEELEAKVDIEDFINELKDILEVIEENKLTDEEAYIVYDKIIAMLNEHEDE